jgi:hypothetical protein
MIRILYLFTLIMMAASISSAQPTDLRLSNLEPRVSKLEGKITQASAAGTVAFLFGAFCALWAQNTGRSAWLWFVLGFLFSVVAVLVLLSKNSSDLDSRNGPKKKPFDLQNFRQQ